MNVLRVTTRFVVIAVVGALIATSCSGSSSSGSKSSTTLSEHRVHPDRRPVVEPGQRAASRRTSMQLERRGETFDHYFVADSLCCPSRSTIFTGLYPHDTHVVTNLPPDGGYQKFQSEDLAKRTFAVALQSGGYATSMLGKYLNGYGDPWGNTGTKVKGNKQNRPAPSTPSFPVAPGWSDWHVANGTGYAEFNYWQNDNGTFQFHPGKQNYGVDVINSEAQSFIKRARDDAVHGRGRDVRAAQAVYAGAAQRQRLSRAHRTARPVLRRQQRQPADVAGPTSRR